MSRITCQLCGSVPTVTVRDEGSMPGTLPWRYWAVVSCCRLGSQHWAADQDGAISGAVMAWKVYYQSLNLQGHPLDGLCCFDCGNTDIVAYVEDRPPLMLPSLGLNEHITDRRGSVEMSCHKCQRAERCGCTEAADSLQKVIARWRGFMEIRGPHP